MDLQEKRDRLVEAILPHAAFDGWSAAAMDEAARDAALTAVEVARLFPGGPIDVVAHFITLIDRRMTEDFTRHPHGNRIGERVFSAIRARFDPWAAHREAIRRALSLLALPQNLPLAMKLGWGSADAVWHTVGDRDSSLARYSKRATMAAILSATLLYWLDDTSEDATRTWAFLRRRLDDIQKLPRLRPGHPPAAGGLITGLLGRVRRPARPWATSRPR